MLSLSSTMSLSKVILLSINNIDKYYEALTMVDYALHDGHVGVSFLDPDHDYTVENIKKFNNYGLSLIELDDGNIIAVNVNEEKILASWKKMNKIQ